MEVVYSSPLPPLSLIPEGNAVTALFNSPHIASAPAKIAVSSCDGPERLTARECNTLAGRFAFWLKQRGVKQGTIVCLFIENSIWTRSLHHGILSLGAIVSPANAQYGPEELAHQLRLSDATYIIAADERLDDTTRALELAKREIDVMLYSELDKTARQLLSEGETISPIQLSSSDHAYYCLSSGTSGLPKCVITTHANIIANTLQFASVDGPLSSPDAILGACLPMSHIFGLLVFIWGSAWTNTNIVVFPRFNLQKLLGAIERHKITAMTVVPPMVLGFAHLPPAYLKIIRGSVRHCMSGAAPLSKSTVKLLQDAAPEIAVLQGYGLTETTPVVLCTLGKDDKNPYYKSYDTASAGWLVPNTLARLVDPETMKDAVANPDGYPRGELWLKGPQVMAGYRNNPQANAETFAPGGWLKTGDIAVVHPDGQFYVVDRIKELIKSRGHQVAPAELEALMLKQEGVLDAAVIGIPDSAAGEELPRAYVVLKEGVNAAKVEYEFNASLPPYKRLRGGLHVIDQIPKSPTGKILRRILRDQARQEVSNNSKPKL